MRRMLLLWHRMKRVMYVRSALVLFDVPNMDFTVFQIMIFLLTRYMEEKIGKLHIVGGYSMYAYEDFTKDEELDFFKKIVNYQNERIKVKQKEIGDIIKERDLVIDLIKEKER